MVRTWIGKWGCRVELMGGDDSDIFLDGAELEGGANSGDGSTKEWRDG